MMKRMILSIIAVFIAWSVLDFVIHSLILQKTYEATAELWRPMEEMKMGLMYLVTLVYAVSFVCVYGCFFKSHTIATGLQYGLILGIGAGFGMGFGTYSYMPIPQKLALIWFLGTVVEFVAAGLLIGWILSGASVSVSATVAKTTNEKE